MKVPRSSDRPGHSRKNRQNQRVRKAKDEQVTELLKICLQKVCELQQDLERSEEFEDDPQAAGYAACAVETMRFLASQGLPDDHPIVQTLTEKLSNKQP